MADLGHIIVVGHYFIMIQYNLIFIFLMIWQLPASACDCSRIRNLTETQSASFEESDLVVIASVESVGESMRYQSQGWFNNKIFEVEVTENFKGAKVGEVLKGHALTSCSGYPDTGLWLIYANIDDEGLISFSTCGLSRAFHKPEQIYYDEYTARPPTKEELENPQPNDDLDWAIEQANVKLTAAKDLKEEVLWLRSMR